MKTKLDRLTEAHEAAVRLARALRFAEIDVATLRQGDDLERKVFELRRREATRETRGSIAVARMVERIGASACPSCGRRFGDHLASEIDVCRLAMRRVR